MAKKRRKVVIPSGETKYEMRGRNKVDTHSAKYAKAGA